MELSSIKDAFDRVAKRQKLSSSRTQDVVDKVGQEIESVLMKMLSIDNATDSAGQKSLFIELSSKLKEIAPMEQLEGSQKELNIALSKYTKFLEKHFNPDISKAYRHVDFDVSMINEILATHCYRQGLFDLGDCFLHEAANEPSATAAIAPLKQSFLEMYKILGEMKGENLEPALKWATAQSKRLLQNGSNLELKLHQLQFVEMLKKGSRTEALNYARKYLAPFASIHRIEIQKLMACLLWAGHLDQSPYGSDDFISLSATYCDKITEELTQQFCSLLGQSYESPLTMAITAGFQGLPTLLKLASVTAVTKKHEWQSMKQLPVPVDLGREFQFHSIFVCPIIREQGSEENPPMLMPCGHVLSKQSIVKLSKNSSRPFKCPFCPLEANVAQCRQLHF
ncbi:uncharacterized protein A4U43_C02F14160 [Asparagus officinalis]|uniref:RING-Gid-type domain-containing protein n=1 Tax=Asparagus officinalis TaxID=4686 RepID=A0A5P1FI66_ASPOF|nr:protein RMD5 homolog A-like [Asparagus officinalis]ONK78085.1 uncharacterized protein A4U43_C02F14160 [Asparagus officinalis]